jgi:hypothetical protein
LSHFQIFLGEFLSSISGIVSSSTSSTMFESCLLLTRFLSSLCHSTKSTFLSSALSIFDLYYPINLLEKQQLHHQSNSPEEEADLSSDVFSLSVLYHKLLINHVPSVISYFETQLCLILSPSKIHKLLLTIQFNSQILPIYQISQISLFCLFPMIARMNHSCSPNTTLLYEIISPFSASASSSSCHRPTVRVSVTATEDIMEREELTMSYLQNLMLSYEERQQYLKTGYDFNCHCVRCEIEEKQLSNLYALPLNNEGSSGDFFVFKELYSFEQEEIKTFLLDSSTSSSSTSSRSPLIPRSELERRLSLINKIEKYFQRFLACQQADCSSSSSSLSYSPSLIYDFLLLSMEDVGNRLLSYSSLQKYDCYWLYSTIILKTGILFDQCYQLLRISHPLQRKSSSSSSFLPIRFIELLITIGIQIIKIMKFYQSTDFTALTSPFLSLPSSFSSLDKFKEFVSLSLFQYKKILVQLVLMIDSIILVHPADRMIVPPAPISSKLQSVHHQQQQQTEQQSSHNNSKSYYRYLRKTLVRIQLLLKEIIV